MGHLFSGRYKALIVDGSGNGYLRTVCEYVHLNPVRAGLLKADQPLKSYPWSSLPAYLWPPHKRPPWLRVDRVFGESDIPKDSEAGRANFERLMEERRLKPDGEEHAKIRRGWCFGEKAFRKELLEQMQERIGPEHYGEDRNETAQEKAEAILEAELRKRRLSQEKLKGLPKGHTAKVQMARRLQAETTMTVGWIAERLDMGSRSYAYRLLYLERKRQPREQ